MTGRLVLEHRRAEKMRFRPEGWHTTDTINLRVLLACSALFICLRWKKSDSLVMLDTPRWMNEGFRFARGEMPYRDYSWQYPPLSIFLLGWSFRWFGVSFTVVQVFIDLLSVAIVMLSHVAVRMLLPRSLHVVTVGLLVVVGATNTKYPLFSMLVYTPAVLTGTIGLLLLMIGTLCYVRGNGFRWPQSIMMVVGFWIATLSKPESLVAAVLVLTMLALLEKELRIPDRNIRS